MGSALLKRFAVCDVAASQHVIKPTPLSSALSPLASWSANLDALPHDYAPDVVILAVKPQMMPEILPPYGRFRDKALYISIAAGLRLARLRELLGQAHAIVRTMPNLPAAIGQGLTTVVSDITLSDEQRDWTQRLMDSLGKTLWLSSEDEMDKAGALAGCGPAFIFAMTEALEQAALSFGFAPDVAALLARQTVIGSGAQLASCDTAPAALRQAVTSHGGTTAAGLAVLMKDHGAGEGALQNLMRLTTEASLRRVREMADGK